MEGEKRNLQQPPTDARSTLASNGKLPWVVWLVGGAVATCLLANSIAPSSLLPKTPLQQEPVAFSPNDACPQPALLTPSTQYYGELDAIWSKTSTTRTFLEGRQRLTRRSLPLDASSRNALVQGPSD
jgi:hypothetical protein